MTSFISGFCGADNASPALPDYSGGEVFSKSLRRGVSRLLRQNGAILYELLGERCD
jgi:hypothetical protein